MPQYEEGSGYIHAALRIWLLFVFSCVAVSCKKHPPTPDQRITLASGVASSSATFRDLGGAARRLDSVTAFDLAASADGATLLWADADRPSGFLRDAELDRDGHLKNPVAELPTPARALGAVSDLSALWIGRALAVSWLERAQSEARAQALVYEGGASAHVLDLGPAWFSPATARGNVALAVDRDRTLVLARGREADCADTREKHCTGFSFFRIGAERADNVGLPMSVPVPCVESSALLLAVGQRSYHGVCTVQENEPVTTLFSIQYQPEYARADALLKGCKPLGMIEAAGKAWLVGDCAGLRRAARVISDDGSVQVEDLLRPRISCGPGSLQIHAAGFELDLADPRAGLQLVLPETIAPRFSRAAWTGARLLVAAPSGAGLRLASYTCEGGELVPARGP